MVATNRTGDAIVVPASAVTLDATKRDGFGRGDTGGGRKARASVETSAASESGAVVARTEPVWTTGSQQIDELIRRYSARYGVGPYFVYGRC
jgi:hypothetical protein